jgi:RHS repeat-associated protein
VPGYVDIVGAAASNATVTVNLQPAERQGEYFRAELAVNNSAGPVWLAVTNAAVLQQGTNADLVTNWVGNLFLPQTPEQFLHDADGNLTNDGRWIYTWDAENRLLGMQSRPGLSPVQKLTFSYDPQGRRISKTVSNQVSGVWSLASDERFVYDGWKLMAILTSDLSPLTSFLWGLDLSGTMQGAGGVGGLLAIGDSQSSIVSFAAYDGNGNVIAVVDAANGNVAANYEYGPFGEAIRATRPLAKAAPVRFSTKYRDDETGLLYYGYRYYDLGRGRWLGRDRIRDPAFQAVYVAGVVSSRGLLQQRTACEDIAYLFAKNEPVGHFDGLGLWTGPAHDAFMSHALGEILEPKYLKILQDANRAVDSDPPSPLDPNYKHSMRAEGESVEAAIKKRDKWIANEIKTAKNFAKKGKCEDALKALGQALHTINDQESPAHVEGPKKEPQIYPGISDPLGVLLQGHSPNDSFPAPPAIERTQDITKKIYDSQDVLIMNAFNQVFPAGCPCRQKMKP